MSANQPQSLFPNSEGVVSLEAQISCVKREIALRVNVYPKWVESGKMKQAQADKELEGMRGVLLTLEAAQRETKRRLNPDVPSDDWRIVEVRDYLRRNAEQGVQCPSCKQNVQIQTYSFTRSCARNLIAIYRYEKQSGEEWIDVPAVLKPQGLARGNDSAMLAWWDLVESRDGLAARTGIYRLTDQGRAFVEGKIRIRKFVRRYNAKSLKCNDETTITISDALGEAFDFSAFLSQRSTGEGINLADETEEVASAKG
jgi:hypothetical protein